MISRATANLGLSSTAARPYYLDERKHDGGQDDMMSPPRIPAPNELIQAGVPGNGRSSEPVVAVSDLDPAVSNPAFCVRDHDWSPSVNRSSAARGFGAVYGRDSPPPLRAMELITTKPLSSFPRFCLPARPL
jgi:hypothetical protein